MKYKINRFEPVGKYFKQDKALDSTIKELREEAKNKQILQARKYKEEPNWGIRYEGVNKYGDLVFSTNSQSSVGRYTQHVRFYDFKEKKPTKMDEVLDMLRNSDVGVSCNDPSFLYWGGAYNATQNGYNIFVETRGLNDPHKETKQNFVICKHLIAVLHAVPFYWNTIIADYKKYFKLLEEQEKPKEETFTKEEVKEAEDFLNIKKEGDSSMNKANDIKIYKGTEATNEIAWRAVFEATISYIQDSGLTDSDVEKIYINDDWIKIVSKNEGKIASGSYKLKQRAKLVRKADNKLVKASGSYELVPR